MNTILTLADRRYATWCIHRLKHVAHTDITGDSTTRQCAPIILYKT